MGYEIDFLPVGDGEQSGDAIALRFGNLYGNRSEQTVVVIDGGFKESGMELVQHIRKYYGTDRVDLVVSTHPDTGHVSGLEMVLTELEVGCLWMHQPWEHWAAVAKLPQNVSGGDNGVNEVLRRSIQALRKLERIAQAKQIPICEPFAGRRDASGCFRVLGPTLDFYESLLPHFGATPGEDSSNLIKKAFRQMGEFVQIIAERWDYETLDDKGETLAENNSSTILLLTVDNRNLLFTGDAGIPALTEAIARLESEGFDFSTITFIQVPHHGSKQNVGPSILNRLVGPKQREDRQIKSTFVSVSKEGEPNHPAKKVTNAFRRRGAPVHPTQGATKLHHYNAPDRGWSSSIPLPFYVQVEK